MREWRRLLLKDLKGFAAPRVLTFREIVARAGKVREGVTEKSVRLFLAECEGLSLLRPVTRGVWLNPGAVPAPSAAEGAAWIRKGAVVSLYTVLGDAGVLNNFSDQVYSVVPSGSNATIVEALGTLFHFRAIKRSVIEAGEPEDRLSAMVPYPRATAEAALVHLLYLAHAQGSREPVPDTQCDMSVLDMKRLSRLAEASGLHDEVFEWVERCRQREADDAMELGWCAP